MALFQSRPDTSSSGAKTDYLAEIKCGRMTFNPETKMVTPEPQKGLLFVEKNKSDNMIHLCWKMREKSSSTKLEDWLCFESDVKVKLITQLPDHRVFFIKFNATNERFFYWIQTAESDSDKESIKKLDMALNNTAELEKLKKAEKKEAGKDGCPQK